MCTHRWCTHQATHLDPAGTGSSSRASSWIFGLTHLYPTGAPTCTHGCTHLYPCPPTWMQKTQPAWPPARTKAVSSLTCRCARGLGVSGNSAIRPPCRKVGMQADRRACRQDKQLHHCEHACREQGCCWAWLAAWMRSLNSGISTQAGGPAPSDSTRVAAHAPTPGKSS